MLACEEARGGGRLLDSKSSIEQAPRLLDYKGNLDQTPLLSLLQSMQAQRATGTLQVRNGGEAFSLFFLFGHLFHAYGNGSQGEDAVFQPLTWRQGDYSFDPKSKLPTEETITAPTTDILAEARPGLAGHDPLLPGQPDREFLRRWGCGEHRADCLLPLQERRRPG